LPNESAIEKGLRGKEFFIEHHEVSAISWL
jgi:hypothetical protein